MPYTPLNQAHIYIQHRVPFQGNSMHARRVPWNGQIRMGMLNENDRRLLTADNEAGDLYVVWSYDTPIAWYVKGAWRIVTQKFSRTTSRHQSVVRRALSPALAA